MHYAGLLRDFLSEPWWAGIGGIVALVALAAAVIAAIDLAVRANREGIRAMSFTVKRTRRRTLDREEVIDYEILARPMGPTVLYEAEWQVFGSSACEAEEFPPLMTANDPEVSLTLSLTASRLDGVSVGVTWVEPRRFGTAAHGARLRLEDSRYQRWMPYWWIWWPRSRHGRWRENRSVERSRLAVPLP